MLNSTKMITKEINKINTVPVKSGHNKNVFFITHPPRCSGYPHFCFGLKLLDFSLFMAMKSNVDTPRPECIPPYLLFLKINDFILPEKTHEYPGTKHNA